MIQVGFVGVLTRHCRATVAYDWGNKILNQSGFPGQSHDRLKSGHSPDGSERVLWFRSKIMSSSSRTFFRRHRRLERKRNGFRRPLLILVLLLLNDVGVAPEVGIEEYM